LGDRGKSDPLALYWVIELAVCCANDSSDPHFSNYLRVGLSWLWCSGARVILGRFG
jgi:hypothetical protein